jgi:hypothetical protein
MKSDSIISWFRMKNHENNRARDERWPWAQWSNLKRLDDAYFELKQAQGIVSDVLHSGSKLKFTEAKQESIRMKLYPPGSNVAALDLVLTVEHHPDRPDTERHWLRGEGTLSRDGRSVIVYLFRLGNDQKCKKKHCRRIYIELYLKEGNYLSHRPFNTQLTPGKGLGYVDPPSEYDVGGTDEVRPRQDDASTGYERPPTTTLYRRRKSTKS